MINIRIQNKNDQNIKDTIFALIEIVNTSDKCQDEEEWYSVLVNLSTSKKKVVFCIDKLDQSGMVMVVINVWLMEFSKRGTIYTSDDAVKSVIKEIYEDEIEFY